MFYDNYNDGGLFPSQIRQQLRPVPSVWPYIYVSLYSQPLRVGSAWGAIGACICEIFSIDWVNFSPSITDVSLPLHGIAFPHREGVGVQPDCFRE